VGNLITVLLRISSRLRHWKNFGNRPVFDEVMPKTLLVCFFPDTVYNIYNAQLILPALFFTPIYAKYDHICGVLSLNEAYLLKYFLISAGFPQESTKSTFICVRNILKKYVNLQN